MFTKKPETPYSIENLTRDLEAALVKARAAHVNQYAIESAIENAMRTQRAYIASHLKF
jgi:hypothetical protein